MKMKGMILALATILLVSCNNCNKKDDAACCAQKVNTATPKTEDMKKIITAQVFVKPDKVALFLEKTKSLIENSRAEEGNISYTLYQDPEDKTKLIFVEEWKNQAAIDIHFAAEHFTAFGSTLEECSASPAVIKIFDVASEK